MNTITLCTISCTLGITTYANNSINTDLRLLVYMQRMEWSMSNRVCSCSVLISHITSSFLPLNVSLKQRTIALL